MTLETAKMNAPVFDRSFLPEADFEFVVIGDTHYMPDPERYAPEFDSARYWSGRAGWALQAAAALDSAFVVHLGDLVQAIPGTPEAVRGRREACDQIAATGLHPYQVAGNMDIGDKPDATMPSEWVTPETLADYHRTFGRSWYSFDSHGIHGVVLNAQLMNGPLPEAEAQSQWLETDLSTHRDAPIFIFIHMPPFFVDEEEPDQGFYNSIDEPARGWLLALLRRYKVEMLFAGHTHFTAFNRVDGTRMFVAPSTTTSRAGFYEAFSIPPPTEQGRNDVAKLGFYLVRVHDGGVRVHYIRTGGATGPDEADAYTRRLVTRLSHDLPGSPLGAYFRTPLAHTADGAIAWPGVIRQRVRDDHPFFACLELGLRHVRIPATDLDDGLQSQRLGLLREEGVQVTACWLLYDRLRLTDEVQRHASRHDAVEVQLPGRLWPDETDLEKIDQCRKACGLPVTLASLLPMESMPGKFHPRTRVGYRASELAELNALLDRHDTRIDRVLCHIDAGANPWDAIQAFTVLPDLNRIGTFDFVVDLPGLDERAHTVRVCEAMFGAATLPGCRLFLDPMVDLDRTNDINHGLLDRLSNPRPAFHTARCLNTILFGDQDIYRPMKNGKGPGLQGHTKRLWLLTPDRMPDASIVDDAPDKAHHLMCIDPVEGRSWIVGEDGKILRETLSNIEDPVILMALSG